MKYGFASLLIFVLSTIVGGIAAKLIYGDVLANVDYIHGVVREVSCVYLLLSKGRCDVI